jgi:hypothetical protein
MKHHFPQWVRASVTCSLVFALTTVQPLQAQSPVIQSSELRGALSKASSIRQKNLEQIQSFFGSEPVRNALSKSSFNSSQIQKTVALLSSDELAKLALRTQKIQADFVAGALNNQQLTYIVIALATAVLVLLIVER